jgi:CHASE3 domain sensor protein
LIGDNPAQADNLGKLSAAIDARLDQFLREMDLVKQNNPAAATALVSQSAADSTSAAIRDVGAAMRVEEERLLAMRTINADRSQVLASSVTIAGSSMVIALGAMSIFLVRRSSRARDQARHPIEPMRLPRA